ncbi:MAG TPA: serine/threonine protein kinase [Planctomycetaceae bacterium]|jgi:serine/threonine protein kinase|nr:protein kinase [Pirellulales bacterium]HCK72455.1 serine/threonine protein kinase [Planctomycetaceae bacterium]HCP84625.1 serine/threonine protein kinase [Planctomycetaceae bacterium]|tara:strand:+ start:10613 stop:12754 length:2142 start_codon:yes stop_codon:yes gene_type:complete
MSFDPTERQSDIDHQRSKQLSLQQDEVALEVPGYKLSAKLGTGAYGEVWVGTNVNTGSKVAIKFFSHESGVNWNLLAHEVEKLVSLATDRYVVQLLEVGWESSPPYYVMEYLEEGSLDQYIDKHHPVDIESAVSVFREIALGLSHAHRKGILHCDLKPANILLDNDQRPRLADFGQSRLSHDQSPALGTLFYMAPEQADMKAVPDVRWDVYALGALLYCLLEGEPPYRSGDRTREIEQSESLVGRLEMYRSLFTDLPAPSKTLTRTDVDPALREIIDQSLAISPEDRLSTPQEILNKLDRRDELRRRRRMRTIGIIGPLVLLIVMGVFGSRGYQQSISEAERAVRTRVLESNSWVSRHVARTVEEEINDLFEIIQAEAANPEFIKHLSELFETNTYRELKEAQQSRMELVDLQQALIQTQQSHPVSEHLKDRIAFYVARLTADPSRPKLASLFVTDNQGTMMSIAYSASEIQTQSVSRSYHWRTYFHGQSEDLDREVPVNSVSPLTRTQLSTVFQSTTTKRWKLAVSTPVYAAGPESNQIVGVMALTIDLGDFAFMRNEIQQNQFAVFVDDRDGQRRGMILQHPIMDESAEAAAQLGQQGIKLSSDQLDDLQTVAGRLNYLDPVHEIQSGDEYAGRWIAVPENVRLPTPINSEQASEESELIILVQERYEAATAPVRALALQLIVEGVLALLTVLITLFVFWRTVARRAISTT